MPVRQLIAAFTLMALMIAPLYGAGPQQGGYVSQQPVNRTATPTNGQFISIMGQVTRPATYQFETTGLRLVDVLATAGGLTPGSNNMVRIVRNGQIVGRLFVTDRTNEIVYPGDLLIADSRQVGQQGTIVESPQVGAAGQFQPMRVSDRKTASQANEMQIALIGLRDYPVVLKIGKQHASVTQMLASLGQNPTQPVHVVSSDANFERSPDWRNQLLPPESVLVFDRSHVVETPPLSTLSRPLHVSRQMVAQAIGRTQNTTKGTQDVTHAITTVPAPNSHIQSVAGNDQFVELPAPPPLLTQVPFPDDELSSDSLPGDEPNMEPDMDNGYVELPAPNTGAGENTVVTRPLGSPLADASGGHFAGTFTPLTDLPEYQMTPLSELPDYPGNQPTTALASTLDVNPGNVEAASTSLISVIVGLVGFLVAGSAGIILVSMARKANRSEQHEPDVIAAQPSASTVLDDLIQDRIPQTEEATALPRTLKFFGHPTGPQKIRIDARHETPAPHFETTVHAGGNSSQYGQTAASNSSGSQMRFDSQHPKQTTSTSRQHQTSRVLDRVLSSVNERGATQQ